MGIESTGYPQDPGGNLTAENFLGETPRLLRGSLGYKIFVTRRLTEKARRFAERTFKPLNR